MKNIIAFFTLILLFGTAIGQNQLRNVFIELNTNGDQIALEIRAVGPGAHQLQALDVTFLEDCGTCGSLNFPLTPSTGNQWTGGGFASPSAKLTKGTISILDENKVVTQWGFLFQLGTGTRTSSTQASTKAELL